MLIRIPRVLGWLVWSTLWVPFAVLNARATELDIELRADPTDSSLAVVTIELPRLEWQLVEGAWVPTLTGLGNLGVVGAPDLPVRNIRVALEAGNRLESRAVDVQWDEGALPGPPAAYPSRGASRVLLNEQFTDGSVAGWWPTEIARVTNPATYFRSVAYGVLQVVPIQIDVGRGRYRVARSIRITVDRSQPKTATDSGLPRATPQPGPLDRQLEHDPGALALGAEWLIGRGSTVPPSTLITGEPDAPNFPAWQFEVKQDGLVQISYSWAQSNAPGLFSYLTANDPRRYRLTTQGVEVPIRVEGESDGVFGAGDAIVFYGQALGAVDPYGADIYQRGDYTDTNLYRLDTTTTPLRVQPRAGAGGPNGTFAVPSSFRATAHHEPNLRFFGLIPSDGVDHWYSDSFSSSTSADGTSQLQTVSTPSHAGGSVTLRSRLLGLKLGASATSPHRSQLWVDGVQRNSADWNGYREFVQGVENGPITFTPAAPLGATTAVQVRLPFPPRDGLSADSVALNWVELDYDRLYTAAADALAFTVDNADREPRLGGFSALAEVWELSQTTTSAAGLSIALPQRVVGAAFTGGQTRFTITTDAAAPAKRSFAAAAPNGYLTPSAVREDQPPSTLDASLGSSLKGPGLGADWVIIGYRPLLDMTSGSRLRNLVTQRQGQGLETAVIDLRDVYDEFTDGIEDPEAIKRFMAYAFASWSPAPSYLVLVGDATRDYKGHYGHPASRQFVPTHMVDYSVDQQLSYYLSDTWFAATAPGSELPQAVVSRIPAKTLAEAEEVFRKLVVYETSAAPASWSGRSLLISENDPDGFFAVHDQIYNNWFSGKPQTATKVYESAQDACTAMNASIDSNVNLGAGLFTYAGHGGYQAWGRGTCSFFSTATSGADDLDDVNNTASWNFQVQANCITGHFAQDNSTSGTNTQVVLMEDWLLATNKGSIGGLAPSHLAFTFQLDSILEPVYEEVWGIEKKRLSGEIEQRYRRDFETGGRIALLQSFVLFGDGATRLRMPAPAAPVIATITPQLSGQLRLTWNAVSGATKYRVLRAQAAQGSYVELPETTATQLTDSGLTNCSEYFYAVKAVDGSNFESAWSNFNRTCDGVRDPADCKSGVPQNPIAPAAPNLLALNDTQRGGQLEAVWDNSTREPDVTDYTVRWGTSPGNYSLGQTTVPATSDRATIGGLLDGTTYYVVVRAENCSQIGGNSNQRSGVPHRVEGLNPPRSIWDLRVQKDVDGDGTPNVKLLWTNPTQTVWGTSTSVASVEVYGNKPGPVFPIDVAHRLSALPSTAVSYVHANQYPATQGLWYYLVATVDSGGQRSAAGTELPEGIEDLKLEKVGGGQLELSWGAVANAQPYPGQSTGHRLKITGYNVYGQPGNLPRASCASGNLRAADLPTTSTTLAMPVGSYYTFQVLAEDAYGGEAVW